MSTTTVDRRLRLLSLDGGGVRGLSSIMILKHLMENLSKQRGHVVQPWEEFDMIGGTSTGGLIAIMLGRLRMTLDECEDAYLNLSERIFDPKRSMFNPLRSKDFLLADGKFDHKILEKAIKEIIVRAGFDESVLLKNPDPQCKVFVCATRTGNTGVAIFRSYDTTQPKLLFEECKIWEACRATSAATTFFDPIKIGEFGQEFADGGVLYNNPIQLVEREASTIWPNRTESAVMVSIGTGSAPGGVFRGSLKKMIEGIKEIVTETEKTDNDFFQAHKAMVNQNRLYRFNVLHGLADIGLEESKEKDKIANATQIYLDRGDMQRMANLCIEQLCKPGSPRVEPSPMKNVDRKRKGSKSDESDSEKSCLEKDLRDCIRSLSFKGITSRRNNISLAHKGTCEWLFKAPLFRKWKDGADLQSNNGVLWIKGHPGVGKSTLMKHTLLYCEEAFKDYNTASYFFNARGGPLEKSPLGMLRSLIVQLLERDPVLQKQFIPHFLQKTRRHRKLGWETGELKEFFLREYARRQCMDTLILIDALDECNDSDVEEVVDFLENLSDNATQSGINLRICLSSRHYPHIDMEKKLELVIERQVEHDQDIFKYVQSKLKAKDKDIQRQILEMSKHIFIWAVLVVELLNIEFKKGKIKAMWKTLNEIPSGLDELLSRILEKGDSEDDKKAAILVFQWVLFPIRPLKPIELYFALLAGTDPDDLGAWDRSQVEFKTVKRFITSSSRGLVEIVSPPARDEYLGTVQFIHQSVIDFLTRNQRLVRLDPTLAPDAIGTSHARLASCCMAYVMQEELKSFAKDISSGANLEKGVLDGLRVSYPLLEYSLENLLSHAEQAQAEGISQISLLRRLENYGGYEILKSLRGLLQRCSGLTSRAWAEVNAQGGLYGIALQAAAAWSSTDIVTLLLDHGANVNAQGGHYGTALQAAAARGRTDLLTLLLNHGDNANAQGGHYGTALEAVAAGGSTDIVTLLLDHGANVNAQGGSYGTALQAAAARGSPDMVALLLNHGANADAQGGHYGTALQAAAARGRTDIVALLLDNGANVNAQGGSYGNALQAATARGDVDIVTLLLNRGSNPP